MTPTAKIIRATSALFLMALLIAWANGLHAQTSAATLSGTVRDATGAVVARSSVTITNSSTGISRKVESDSQGRYSFSNVEPGRYELSVEHPGFKKAVEKEVLLTVGGSSTLDVGLQIGAVSESVTVTTASRIIVNSRYIVWSVVE
jgi:Ulp1 family protease